MTLFLKMMIQTLFSRGKMKCNVVLNKKTWTACFHFCQGTDLQVATIYMYLSATIAKAGMVFNISVSLKTKKCFTSADTSCSVDRHISGCEYFGRCLYVISTVNKILLARWRCNHCRRTCNTGRCVVGRSISKTVVVRILTEWTYSIMTQHVTSSWCNSI